MDWRTWNRRFADVYLSVLCLATMAMCTPVQWVARTLEAIVAALAALAIAVAPMSGLRPAVPFLIAAAVGIVQITVGASVSSFDTGTEVLFWIALAACAYLSAISDDLGSKALLERGAGFALVITVLGAAQFFTSNGRMFWLWPSGEPNVFGPFLSRNNFASFVLLFLPTHLAKALGGSRWSAAAYAASLAAVISSGSRAGAALAVAESVVTLLVFGGRTRKAIFQVAGISALAVAAGGWEILAHKLNDRNPLYYRREMMAAAVEMTAAHPLAGVGLGGYPVAYPAFARKDVGLFVNHAHNEWLEAAAEGGIGFGLLLGTALAIAIRKAWGTPWAIALIALALHGLVDYPFERLGLACWIVTVAVLAGRQFPNSHRQYGV